MKIKFLTLIKVATFAYTLGRAWERAKQADEEVTTTYNYVITNTDEASTSNNVNCGCTSIEYCNFCHPEYFSN